MAALLTILGTLLSFVLGLFIILWMWGRHLRRQGQAPIDENALAEQGAKLATTKDGRKIDYVVYGSDDSQAPVVINLHGSGPEAMCERALHAPACEALGVRGIAISLPGYGYTDAKPGRKVKDWPAEDLSAVLDAEGVDTFMITGHSQGNPHAMAAAWHFKKRCVGLGLNAPLLPAPLTRELNLPPALAMDSLLRTQTLRKPWMAWYFAAYHVGASTLAPWAPMKGLIATAPNLRQAPATMKAFRDSFVRAVARGSVGAAWETALDVCYEWGFEVREIETKNVAVWHAADDNACPPAQGKWLAEFFAAKEGARVNFRDDNLGYGHVTYCQGEFLEPATSMIKALLDGRS